MDDDRQDSSTIFRCGMALGPAWPLRPDPLVRGGDQPSIVPALAALAASLVEVSGAAAAAITVFDSQHRWITVTHGPAEIAPGTELFLLLSDACGAATGQPFSRSTPDDVRAVCRDQLLLDSHLPSRLDILCMSGRGGALHGALCVLDAAPEPAGGTPGAHMTGLSAVVMRLLDLHNQLEDYQHVVMLSPHMSYASDADGHVVEIAEVLQVLLGIDEGAELDRQFRALVHPDDEDTLVEAWRKALAGEIPVEVDYRLRVRSGSYRWFHAHAKPRRDASGRVTRWCALLEDIHERREDRMRLAHLAYHDALTGLSNRAHFRLAVERRLRSAQIQTQTHRSGFAVARLELHEFRAVTGAFGHAIGDRLLLGASRRIGLGVRSGDLLAHGGGNEFFLLLDGIETQEQAVLVLDRVLCALSAPMQVDGSVVAVGAAVGVTLSGPHDPAEADTGATQADRLMQHAELALLRARSAGRRGCCFYAPDMDEKVRRIEALKVDMTCALGDEQFFLVYQPVLDVRTGRVTSLEALVRWRHPTRGIVPPADFIPEAENNGLIVPIGEWVLGEACRAAARWPGPLRVGVNLSSVQVRAPGLVDVVARALERSGLEPSRLVLEITESVPLLGEADNLATLRALQELGVRIALDDFGTGYASLSYLQCFSFDMIKIERAFVQRMLDSNDARLIVRAVIRLSQSLGSPCVAEGVETVEQLDVLREEGCDSVQGYLFSRPVEADSVDAVVSGLDRQADETDRALQDAEPSRSDADA